MVRSTVLIGLTALIASSTVSGITIDAADTQLMADDIPNNRITRFRLIDDLDGDGQADLVTAFGNLVALSSATSEVIWQSPSSAGNDVAVVQDRNTDGISDLVSQGSGNLIVTSGADGSELTRVANNLAFLSLTEIDDQNADGIPEVLAREGLVSVDVPDFRIHILDGATLAPLRVIGDSSRRVFAGSVAEIDDLNNDGISDLLVTVSTAQTEPGALPAIRLYAGGSFGFLDEFQISDSGGQTHTAEYVISPGDVDGDGISDIVVAGRASLDAAFLISTVVVDLYSGETRELLWRTVLDPDLTMDAFTELSTGRVDGDSVNDIAIPLLNPTNSSTEVQILSGFSGQIINRFTSDDPDVRLDQSALLADLDADGLTDVTVKAWSFDDSQDVLGLIFRGRSAQADITSAQLSGGWVDRFGNFPNQGVFLEFTESSTDEGSPLATLIWYGYQGNDQRFLIGGPIPVPDASSLLTFDLISATGAQFGDDFVSSDVSRLNRGQAVLHIGQCDQVDLHVSLDDGEQSTLSLEPFLASTFGLPCQAIQARSLQSPNKTGIWWNQSRDGEGYFIDSVDTGEGIYTFAAWFAYNQGNALWVAGGGFADEQNDQAILESITAQRDGSAVELIPFGTLTLDFDSCGSGNLSYQAIADSVVGEQTGSIAITDDFTGPLIGVDCQN